jgi:hypothetical protein
MIPMQDLIGIALLIFRAFDHRLRADTVVQRIAVRLKPF